VRQTWNWVGQNSREYYYNKNGTLNQSFIITLHAADFSLKTLLGLNCSTLHHISSWQFLPLFTDSCHWFPFWSKFPLSKSIYLRSTVILFYYLYVRGVCSLQVIFIRILCAFIICVLHAQLIPSISFSSR